MTTPEIELHALVADDDAAIRRLVVAYLDRMISSCVIHEAETGEDALAKIAAIKQKTRDTIVAILLFTDWNMGPGIRGDELIKQARALIATDFKIFSILATGNFEEASCRFKDGDFLIIEKPFDARNLLAVINNFSDFSTNL